MTHLKGQVREREKGEEVSTHEKAKANKMTQHECPPSCRHRCRLERFRICRNEGVMWGCRVGVCDLPLYLHVRYGESSQAEIRQKSGFVTLLGRTLCNL